MSAAAKRGNPVDKKTCDAVACLIQKKGRRCAPGLSINWIATGTFADASVMQKYPRNDVGGSNRAVQMTLFWDNRSMTSFWNKVIRI